MVDVEQTLDDNGKIKYTITTDKANVSYFVSKSENGYSSYFISMSKGNIAESLGGVYTTPDKALKVLLKHIDNMKDSITVQRDKKYTANKEWKKKQNGSEVLPDDKDNL